MRDQIRRRELSALAPAQTLEAAAPFAGAAGSHQRSGIQTDLWLMKYDEFAFFNQQLAAMLREGIPLEGALRRLCQEMRQGPLRTELQALEADLAKGPPWRKPCAAPIAGTVQTHDPGGRQGRRPARRTDHARGLFPEPEQRLDAAQEHDDLPAHCDVRGLCWFPWRWRSFGPVSSGRDSRTCLAAWGSACPAATLFALAIVELHLGVSGDAGHALCARGRARVICRPCAENSCGGCRPSRRPPSPALRSSLALLMKNGVPLPEAIGLVRTTGNQPGGGGGPATMADAAGRRRREVFGDCRRQPAGAAACSSGLWPARARM